MHSAVGPRLGVVRVSPFCNILRHSPLRPRPRTRHHEMIAARWRMPFFCKPISLPRALHSTEVSARGCPSPQACSRVAACRTVGRQTEERFCKLDRESTGAGAGRDCALGRVVARPVLRACSALSSFAAPAGGSQLVPMCPACCLLVRVRQCARLVGPKPCASQRVACCSTLYRTKGRRKRFA